MFSVKHLIILGICFVYTVCCLLLLNKKRPKLKSVVKYLLTIGIISETLKICSYVNANEAKLGGYLPKSDLPFHLCSIQIIFMVVLVLSEKEKLKRTIYSFMLPTCLVGGFAALMIPTSSSLSMPVVTVQYFLYHSSIMIFAIYLYMTDEIKFTFDDYISSLFMLLGTFFVAIYLNSIVYDGVSNVNFMYAVNPPMQGMPFLNKDHGWVVYICRYVALALVIDSLCYTRQISQKIKEKVKKAQFLAKVPNQ